AEDFDGLFAHGQLEVTHGAGAQGIAVQGDNGTSGDAQTTDGTIHCLGNALGRAAGVIGHGYSLAAADNGGATGCQGSGAHGAATGRTDLVGTDLVGSDAVHADVDGFVGVGADLEGGGTEGAVQQIAATEGGGFGDTVQLRGQRAVLGLHGGAVFVTVGTVGGLQSQFAHALQNGGGFAHGRFSGLCDGDTIVGVLGGNVQAVDLAGQTVGNLQTGGIILGAVDAQAAGQTLHAGGQAVRSTVQVLLSSQGSNVGINGESHLWNPHGLA